MHSGDTGEGQGDDGDDGVEFRPPLPPEDRIWRHPSEVAGADRRAPGRSARTDRRVPRILGVAAVSGLIGATLSLGVVAALGGFSRDTLVVERNVAIQPVTSVGPGSDSVTAIVARTGPAIAAVRVRGAGRDATVSGSAIVLRSDGHLLTNAQLVEGAESIEVRLHRGAAITADVVGTDPETDVAVLKVDLDDLEPAALGSAETVEIGDRAVALGAVDAGGWSTEVATGVISSLDRRLESAAGHARHGMMIVDVRLAHGAAGGPLLDATGAVVGITSGDVSSGDEVDREDGQRFCAATPIDVAVHVADQIIEHGRARHVWLGIEGSDLPAAAASALDVPGGAAIGRVVADSPAADAGLQDGDVIVGFDAEAIDSMSDLIAALRAHRPDDRVTLQIRRGDELRSITVVLAEKPSTP